MLHNFSLGEMEMEEIQEKADQIIKKLFKDRMAKEKNKTQYNFAEDMKRMQN
jgi:hypothetical protein